MIAKPSGDIDFGVSPYALIWMLWLTIAWLTPSLTLPWPSFDRELLMAGAILALAGVMSWPLGDGLKVPGAAWILCLVAGVPLAQWLAGLVPFLGDAIVSAAYVFGFACALLLGANRPARGDWLTALMSALVIGAIVSVGLQFHQWLQVNPGSLWVLALPPGARPFANLGQPNLLSTLLVWGMLGLWWGVVRGAIGGSVAVLAGCWLACGLVMAQSRTVWISGLICALIIAWQRNVVRLGRSWPALAVVIVTYGVGMAEWKALNSSLLVANVQTLASRTGSGELRLEHWSALWQAIGERPWSGWGWNQVSVAQQHVAPALARVPELLGYSHNLAIDLLVWNGLPLGVLLILCCLCWLVRAARSMRSAEDVLLFMALVVFGVHCLLEYPHAYSFLLLPAGLMAGALERARQSSITIPRWWLGVIVGLAALLLSALTVDYFAARSSLERLRFESAHVGPSRNSLPPRLPTLSQLEAFLTVERIKELDKVEPASLELMRVTSERFPTDTLILRYAIAAAAAGRTSDASRALVRLCKVYPATTCQNARQAWNILAEKKYPAIRATPFPDP